MLRAVGKLSSSQLKSLPVRLYSQKSGAASTAQPAPNPDVSGLSEKCVAVPTKPVGPNASKNTEYKNPEYFCYHVDSFAEAEVEMAKFRLPPPTNREKFTRNL
ncbi:NADH dehydrogenase [ubiquinone] flavoprotein 3, mitochondrial [Diachasma alloeum]|uniref:NADH dehydrogenase [ubiquinone] flavoprotein 3, mitochondrial n=1 Tax=Diachasma alloeum TaxID=454923 RepID=UPI00073830DF|nr:NADH dehydrogenase [ubiquinone] flavoprotein 3, mitochondrial [Diachasma alloeum]